MPLSQSPAAYTDCAALLDQALESEKGVRITCDSKGMATNLRQRLYKARQLDQKQNAESYPKGEPLHGRSVYDRLTVTVDENFVVIRKLDAMSLTVEEL